LAAPSILWGSTIFMSLHLFFLLVLGLSIFGYMASRGRAAAFNTGNAKSVHSRPNQHGWFSLLWGLVPAAVLLISWSSFSSAYIEPTVLANVPAAERPVGDVDQQTFMNEVKGLASGEIEDAFNPASKAAAQNYVKLSQQSNLVVGGLAIACALAGIAYAFTRVKPDFRARTRVENFAMYVLIAASAIAILTTFGILFSLVFESFRFFQKVSVVEFLFGTRWSPQEAIRADQVGSSGAFGAVPLFWGTAFISLIAMIVSVPIGLMAAIYLTQYSSSKTRKILKPVLEVLAGVPTVVYGFFAALTVAPAVRDIANSMGISASSESALAAGLVMGVMIIPFMSSLSDDAITAVPAAMKDGSLAMGATPSETIKKVLIPAALPGIMGGFLLALSRAIGETMIVVMAAGLAANLTANPFQSVTTVTAQIVALLTGDQEFDSAKTLSAFALGLVLFLVTLALNVFALRIVKKYREAYE
jgi:phosphate transport system permease protein